jgi:Skp family chaperone for outer membrane proteins
LVHAVESGTVDLEKMDRDELPSELRKMKKAELEQYIADQSKQPKELQDEIETLAKKRQAYIEEKLKNERNRGADSLDAKIYKCIQTQAAQKDIAYTGGPEY